MTDSWGVPPDRLRPATVSPKDWKRWRSVGGRPGLLPESTYWGGICWELDYPAPVQQMRPGDYSRATLGKTVWVTDPSTTRHTLTDDEIFRLRGARRIVDSSALTLDLGGGALIGAGFASAAWSLYVRASEVPLFNPVAGGIVTVSAAIGAASGWKYRRGVTRQMSMARALPLGDDGPVAEGVDDVVDLAGLLAEGDASPCVSDAADERLRRGIHLGLWQLATEEAPRLSVPDWAVECWQSVAVLAEIAALDEQVGNATSQPVADHLAKGPGPVHDVDVVGALRGTLAELRQKLEAERKAQLYAAEPLRRDAERHWRARQAEARADRLQVVDAITEVTDRLRDEVRALEGALQDLESPDDPDEPLG